MLILFCLAFMVVSILLLARNFCAVFPAKRTELGSSLGPRQDELDGKSSLSNRIQKNGIFVCVLAGGDFRKIAVLSHKRCK